MRIRYAYKLEDAEGNTSFVVLNHILSEEEVQAQLADKGIVKATFHERVRTGYRLNAQGELEPTGLSKKSADAPAEGPAAEKAPKAKSSKKNSKK